MQPGALEILLQGGSGYRMKREEIIVGKTYIARISGQFVPVRIDRENEDKRRFSGVDYSGHMQTRKYHGGWQATNLKTNREIRIKSAAKLRREARPGDMGLLSEVFHDPIPANFPVQPLKEGETAISKATCGTCGLSWDDGKSTEWTPTPAGRCPFEYFHK